MIGLSAFRLPVATFVLVSAFSFNAHAHAETVMQLIEHEFPHQGKHHTYSRNSGNSAPMGDDDSLFGNPSSLHSEPLCTAQYFKGDSPVFINQKLSAKTELGCFDNFTVMHSGVTRTPLWSAEHLTRDTITAAAHLKRRGFKFEVQQLRVAWCNVFPPRRIPRAGFDIQALFEAGG